MSEKHRYLPNRKQSVDLIVAALIEDKEFYSKVYLVQATPKTGRAFVAVWLYQGYRVISSFQIYNPDAIHVRELLTILERALGSPTGRLTLKPEYIITTYRNRDFHGWFLP